MRNGPDEVFELMERLREQGSNQSSYRFFAYDPEEGFNTFKTALEAEEAAQEYIDYFRDNSSEGWDEMVGQVCWGKIRQATIQVGTGVVVNFEGNDVEAVDYVLYDV